MATGASFHTLSSPTALCAFIVAVSYYHFAFLSLSFLGLSFFFSVIPVFPFFVLSIFILLIIRIAPMASSSSRKRRERTPSPSEGEGSSSSTLSDSHKVTKRPAFPLWDPWYSPSPFFPQVSHGEAPPSPHAWMFSGQAGFAGSAQVPNPRDIFNLQIRQGIREAVLIFFDFVPRKIQGWPIWVDKKLSDVEFVGRLEHAGILKAVDISKNLEGFKDAKGLRHLVRRWCPSLHTFFFFVGELTITLEDVVNNFLLPVFGDESPFDINLSEEDLVVEDKLFGHFGGRAASPGGKPARMGR